MQGLTIFFIPTAIVNYLPQTIIYKFLSEQGFLILNTHFISIQNVEKISHKCEFFPALTVNDSGIIMIGFDVEPMPTNLQEKLEFPCLDNARYLLVQKIYRYYKIPLKLKDKSLIYITKNSIEAQKTIKILLPQAQEKLKDTIAQLRSLWSTSYPVIKRLSLGKQRRAKVELIEYQGQLAVKKTFRPGCDRFLARELLVMSEFSKNHQDIPEIIHHESCFVISPFHQNTLDFNSSLKPKIPLEIAKQIINIMKYFYDLGYALIDFNPDNLILDGNRGLKIIDFEFIYRYPIKPVYFKESYDLVGIPDDFDGDVPVRSLKYNEHKIKRNYNTVWKPYFQIELSEILESF